MGLTCSYGVLHTGNLTWRLKSSSLTRFEINCERNMRGVTLSPAISKWQQSLNNFLFSNLVVLFAGSKRECFGNPCGGRGVSPHLNASSQHIYLSLLQVVSVFKFHTFDLDVVSSFRMLSPLNGIPSKQLKPRKIGAAVRQIMNLSSVELSHFNSASIFKSQSLEVPRYEFCAI